jgi:hypothetical protein
LGGVAADGRYVSPRKRRALTVGRFGWRKIEAGGAGHREMEMFNASAAVDAIR